MVNKLKPILPSLREKKRYVAFEAISKSELSLTKVSSDITHSLHNLIGLLGAAKAGAMVLGNKWDNKSKKGLIKINHKHVEALKASFVLAGDNDTLYRSLGVSGILKKAENKYIKNNSK